MQYLRAFWTEDSAVYLETIGEVSSRVFGDLRLQPLVEGMV